MKQKANNSFVETMELNQNTFTEDTAEKGSIYAALEDLGIKVIHTSTIITQICLISLTTYVLWHIANPFIGIMAGTVSSVYTIAKM